ncbi:MAG: hypothetical protein IH595_07655 [Bacteroidales bacterium]|nr:hypothetical protein [Bacteroidales bacterium]
MKYLLLDKLETKISAFAGKSLLFHFPGKGFFSLLFTASVNSGSNNGQLMLLQMTMVNTALNNQRFNQQSIQQQIRIT